MKVRWTKSSIRLRITPTELNQLARRECVEERLCAIGSTWAVRILPDPVITDLCCEGGTINLRLSDVDRDSLLLPENEGVYFKTDGSTSIRYFIEKDFPCIHPRSIDTQEPETETFIAPVGFEVRKAK